MAPSPFRSTAVVCGIVTATLGLGLVTPDIATAASAAPAAASPSAAPSTSTASPTADADVNVNGSTDIDAIPIDQSLGAPRFVNDWSTLDGARTIVGDAGGDAAWLVGGDFVYDYSTAGGAMVLNVQNRYDDARLEVIRVHTAEDGTRTRTDRIPLPWEVTVAGLEDENTFTPGPNHFAGTASAGSTITAKDTTTGATLFTTKTTDAPSGVGNWSADADLSDTGHVITLTQTTTSGQTTQLRGLTFSPAPTGAPNAPTLETTERLIDGSFDLAGAFDTTAGSIVVQDEAGTTIAEAALHSSGWVAKVPQEYVGSVVTVVGRAADGTESPGVPTRLEQLPTDETATTPSLRSVLVHPDGRVQVDGKPDDAPARWILDGDRVVASNVQDGSGWSTTIDAASTGEQLDVANLVFDGLRWSGMSERVALPRLLQVDGIADTNTYEPGVRTFSGKAEAGATITATDQDGHQLFSTEVSGTKSGVGTWTADADLTGTDGYEVTFTQTTTDGRKSVMPDITFDATQDDTPAAPSAEGYFPEDVAQWAGVAGIGRTGSTITVRNADDAVIGQTEITTESGLYNVGIDPSKVGSGKQHLKVTQTIDGATSKSVPVELDYGQNAPAFTSPTDGSTVTSAGLTFTGTGDARGRLQVVGTDFTNDRSIGHADVENGTWTLSNDELSLPAGDYQFWAHQRTKGGKIALTAVNVHLADQH